MRTEKPKLPPECDRETEAFRRYYALIAERKESRLCGAKVLAGLDQAVSDAHEAYVRARMARKDLYPTAASYCKMKRA